MRRKISIQEIDTRIAWFKQTGNTDMVEFLGLVRDCFESIELTLRDRLAAAALPAIYEQHTKMTDLAAELAYEQADEMLKARAFVGDPPTREER